MEVPDVMLAGGKVVSITHPESIEQIVMIGFFVLLLIIITLTFKRHL